MEADPDPTVQRHLVRMELKKARDEAKMKQAAVAEAMDWSLSKLMRIESGQVGISTNDLRQLLSHYGMKDSRKVNDLVELAKSSRGASVYEKYDDVLAPGFKKYLSYEGSTSVIRHYDLVVVSGLLQTEEYARAIIEHVAGRGPDEATKGWQIREQRQQLHERVNPPEMFFIMDEAVVRRRVRRQAHVMRHQLERLKVFAAEPHISIQIIPFDRGAHPGMAGNFTLLEFKDPNLDDMVYLESHGNLLIREDAETIARYGDKFQQLERLALPTEESEALLDQLISEI
ncbi:MAG: helix-turn-helix transcriptional regulator [Actinomycetota bacterium]|nr:helix-turn-helix transcriptional regulator [Actinomycetota bacterium]